MKLPARGASDVIAAATTDAATTIRPVDVGRCSQRIARACTIRRPAAANGPSQGRRRLGAP